MKQDENDWSQSAGFSASRLSRREPSIERIARSVLGTNATQVDGRRVGRRRRAICDHVERLGNRLGRCAGRPCTRGTSRKTTLRAVRQIHTNLGVRKQHGGE